MNLFMKASSLAVLAFTLCTSSLASNMDEEKNAAGKRANSSPVETKSSESAAKNRKLDTDGNPSMEIEPVVPGNSLRAIANRTFGKFPFVRTLLQVATPFLEIKELGCIAQTCRSGLKTMFLPETWAGKEIPFCLAYAKNTGVLTCDYPFDPQAGGCLWFNLSLPERITKNMASYFEWSKQVKPTHLTLDFCMSTEFDLANMEATLQLFGASYRLNKSALSPVTSLRILNDYALLEFAEHKDFDPARRIITDFSQHVTHVTFDENSFGLSDTPFPVVTTLRNLQSYTWQNEDAASPVRLRHLQTLNVVRELKVKNVSFELFEGEDDSDTFDFATSLESIEFDHVKFTTRIYEEDLQEGARALYYHFNSGLMKIAGLPNVKRVVMRACTFDLPSYEFSPMLQQLVQQLNAQAMTDFTKAFAHIPHVEIEFSDSRFGHQPQPKG
jgi:hypothetical protein